MYSIYFIKDCNNEINFYFSNDKNIYGLNNYDEYHPLLKLNSGVDSYICDVICDDNRDILFSASKDSLLHYSFSNDLSGGITKTYELDSKIINTQHISNSLLESITWVDRKYFLNLYRVF